MSPKFFFQFTPLRLALVSSLIYLAFTALSWIALIALQNWTSVGIWGLTATRWAWAVLNSLLFFVAFLVAWQIVMAKFR